MVYEQKFPAQRISATVSAKFWKLAKENHIGWSDALRVGLSLIFAERGVEEYDNRLNIVRKKQELVKTLEIVSREKEEEIELLKSQIKVLEKKLKTKENE